MDNDLIIKILLLIAAYLIGCISPSFLIAKYIYGFDIRTKGSGNPGTTNALRTMGPIVALITLVLDVLKGSAGAYLGYKFFGSNFSPLTGLMSILGHNYPFYLKFKGGKGVATTIGVAAVVAPNVLFFCGGIGLIVLAFTKMVSAAAVTGFALLVGLSIFILITQGIDNYVLMFLFVGILNIYRHRENIKRILNGTENKIGKK
ncbi:MAG: glycerol-3-phosphate 1-O-acyltransferase PlsY [Tissierellia bacterium]|nr:glycerol-3-phosphate 1-O-acyltransferase PlsY [Tissierellia bacterium]